MKKSLRHCGGCSKAGSWRKCVACRKPTCTACSSPESGCRNAARKIVPWRCKRCESREVQTLDFEGEKVWESIRQAVKDGHSDSEIAVGIARDFTVTEVVRAMLARMKVEVKLPDVVNPPTAQYDKEMRWLAHFAEADRIECLGTQEGDSFVLTKRGRKLVIHAKPSGAHDARLDVEDPGPL